MKKLMIIIWCSLFALIGFSQMDTCITDNGDTIIWNKRVVFTDCWNMNTPVWNYDNPDSEYYMGNSLIKSLDDQNLGGSPVGSLYMEQSGNSGWGFIIIDDKEYKETIKEIEKRQLLILENKLLISNLIPQLIDYSLDTVPVLDSVIYEKIAGDWYRRDYTSDYIIFYTMPEDSTTLDADSIRLQLVVDSLDREINVADRRIDRMRDRISFEFERKRQLRNELQDARLKLRELLKIRHRYYRRL